ncbi:uncharacterized protein LOC132406696 [Hypanus sabinus]|uniref:uncharacterized protein LOC132406696 n=1 Tax=Hypanus sabinus TaxID=79690 RepID=UPI0028C3F7F2|nr:uncharacterized protein LOC132406696 [Hypanus sabinus]
MAKIKALQEGEQVMDPVRGFKVSQEIKLVPPFEEMDVDRYFLHFEKVAMNQNWPKDKWAVLLQSVLKGKAQQAYFALSADEAKNYDEVKGAILKIYELVPEAYQQRFRNLRKPWDRTHLEFAREMHMYFECWCASKEASEDLDKLKQLMLIEQFKSCVPEGMQTYLDEKEAKTLSATAKLADKYALTHKVKFPPSKSYQRGSRDGRETPPAKSESKPGTRGKGKEGEKQTGWKFPSFMRNNSGKAGHIACKCLDPKKETGKGKAPTPTACIKPAEMSLKEKKPNSVQEGWEKFLLTGLVSVKEGSIPVPVRIWRDTRAFQSLILSSVLDFSAETETGDVVIQGVGKGTEAVPLHKIVLKCELVSRPVTIGVQSALLIRDVDVLLGNDLAGWDVFPIVQLTSKPVSSEDPPTDSEVYPACAAVETNSDVAEADVDLAETFLPTLYQKGLRTVKLRR